MTVVRFPRPQPPETPHDALADRLLALRVELAVARTDLGAEMHARARAEEEEDEARALVRDVQRRMDRLETENRRLWRLLGSRLLEGATPFVLAGSVAGFLAVVALRWAGA